MKLSMNDLNKRRIKTTKQLNELFKEFIMQYAKEKAKEDIENGRTKIDSTSEFAEELEYDYHCFVEEALAYYKTKYYDYYCKEYRLPKIVVILASDLEINNDLLLIDSDELEDMFNDYLSDMYGYCLESYTYNIENNEIIVSNIVWDIME